MSGITIFDSGHMFIIILFTLVLVFLIVLFVRAGNRDNRQGEGYEFDRVCPDCHKLLKKEWKNCPYCGHKETNDV